MVSSKKRSILLQRVIINFERKEQYTIDIYEAMDISISAWNDGSDMIMFDIFRHEGFIKEIDIQEEFHVNMSYGLSEDELFVQFCRRKT